MLRVQARAMTIWLILQSSCPRICRQCSKINMLSVQTIKTPLHLVYVSMISLMRT